MEAFKIGIFIITSIFFIVILLHLSVLISNLAEHIKIKSGLLAVETEKKRKDTGISLDQRILTTNNILRLINGLVDLEVTKKVSMMSLLRQRYNMLNMDTDIKQISTKVFLSVKNEIYSNEELILTTDFFLQYITSQTTFHLTTSMVEFNQGLYIPKDDSNEE